MRHPERWLIAGAIAAMIVIGGVGAMLLAGGGSSNHSKNHPDYTYGAQRFEDQGREHIPQDQPVSNYNSDPPTSGPHWSVRGLAPAPWGLAPSPVANEAAVHNMEHGGVVVWYNCDGGPAPLQEAACDALVEDLADIVEPRAEDGMFILMTQRSGMENRVALTAWTVLDAFDEFDESRINAFIASFECKPTAPEARIFCK